MKHSSHKTKTIHITQSDFMKANRRAARLEDIEAHGKPTTFRPRVAESKRVYNRKRLPKINLQKYL